MITLGDFQIEEGDHVVVFAMNECIQKVEDFFK
jgi:Trk K+ transport system NAD-binding subunit